MGKFFIVFLGTFIGIKSFACIDISGTYKSDNHTDASIYEFVQNGCESIKLKRYDGVSTVPEYEVEWKTDGNPVVVSNPNEPDIVNSYHSQFIGKELLFTATSLDKTSGQSWKRSESVFQLDSSGKVLTESHVDYNFDGKVIDSFANVFLKK